MRVRPNGVVRIPQAATQSSAVRRWTALAGLLTLVTLLATAFGARAAAPCMGWPVFAPAAHRNGQSLADLIWSPYGAPEKGWTVYVPLVSQELGTRCAPDTAGFAWALSRWQTFNRLAPTGLFGPAEFAIMKTRWQQARPFVRLRGQGVCPTPPDDAHLAPATAGETLQDKPVRLATDTLAAYRAMVATARRETWGMGEIDLKLVSGFRSPDYDAERCAHDHNCDGVRRAVCSAHRTGRALDLALPNLAGSSVDSAFSENRAHQTRSVAYAWLAANAWRFGFVNYTYEPWHWEWTGPALLRSPPRQP
jgi:D-alanyl-D-alanine carboxypeptidase